MGGGLVDVDALVEELMTNMSKSSQVVYRPKEVVEFVAATAEGMFARDRKNGQFPIGAPPRMKVVAKKPARRDLVRKGQG